ncbi:MAG: creatininase family protein [Opitutales bacterium]|nr:creatininase family protein [Opitutales bacterium]MCH8539445.1 creatininase family protein [Opitutales bacterium]
MSSDGQTPFDPHLGHYTWPDLRALQKESDLLLLPVGATEQHGPALPVNTDSLIAEALAEAAAKEAGVLMAPVLTYSSSAAHTLQWPGTFALKAETFIDTVVQLGQWALHSGWRKLLLVNAHAGNDAPLRVALDHLRLEGVGRWQVGLVQAHSLNEEIAEAFYADAADYHANQAEADLIRHLAPHLMAGENLTDSDDPDRTRGLVFSYPVAQTSRNGTTGYPSRGNAQRGAQLFDQMKNALRELIQRAQTETPPVEGISSPVVPWNR